MLESVSVLVGMGKCNANCKHCAGKIHRQYAPKEDGVVNVSLTKKTLEECYSSILANEE